VVAIDDSIPPPPSLNFDTYNKLTIANVDSDATSNIDFFSNTYEMGSRKELIINDGGTYHANIYSSNTLALVKKQVTGTIGPSSGTNIAFHYNTFSWGGDPYSDGSVTAAATAGHVYSDTPTGTYTWGSLDSASTASNQTTYTWTPASTVTSKVLMVAGGGGGGTADNANGGGGGGGYYGGAAGGGQGGGGGGSGRIEGPLMIPQSEGGPFINYYTGSGRNVNPNGYSFTEYPLLGSSPTTPTQPWGSGGMGQNTPNRSYQRNNGFVIIHAFSGGVVPSADDLPQNVNDFVISATY